MPPAWRPPCPAPADEFASLAPWTHGFAANFASIAQAFVLVDKLRQFLSQIPGQICPHPTYPFAPGFRLLPTQGTGNHPADMALHGLRKLLAQAPLLTPRQGI